MREEPIKETVEIPTGKTLMCAGSGSGVEKTVIDTPLSQCENTGGLGYSTTYHPHKLSIATTDAVQMLIDYLGLEIEYTPNQEEVIGKLLKPRKRRKG